MMVASTTVDVTQIILAVISAVQLVVLAILNRRSIDTNQKINGHLADHVNAAVAFERQRQEES